MYAYTFLLRLNACISVYRDIHVYVNINKLEVLNLFRFKRVLKLQSLWQLFASFIAI